MSKGHGQVIYTSGVRGQADSSAQKLAGLPCVPGRSGLVVLQRRLAAAARAAAARPAAGARVEEHPGLDAIEVVPAIVLVPVRQEVSRELAHERHKEGDPADLFEAVDPSFFKHLDPVK